MKSCKKCGEIKPLSEFNANRRMADGHLNTCKICASAMVKRYRQENLEKLRIRDRIRYDTDPKIRERIKQREQSIPPEQKYARNSVRGKQFRKQHPDKDKAHRTVNNAIRDGKLERQPCEVCGTTFDVEAHHEDYSKPLNVRWLCTQHHGITRRKPRTEVGISS